MATTITELTINQAEIEGVPTCWAINVSSDDASTEQTLLAAVANKRHFIETITIITATSAGDWLKLKDGTDTILGPLVLSDGVPFEKKFIKELICPENTPVTLKTESDFGLFLLIEGTTH